jgi:hypothetical protein
MLAIDSGDVTQDQPVCWVPFVLVGEGTACKKLRVASLPALAPPCDQPLGRTRT